MGSRAAAARRRSAASTTRCALARTGIPQSDIVKEASADNYADLFTKGASSMVLSRLAPGIGVTS